MQFIIVVAPEYISKEIDIFKRRRRETYLRLKSIQRGNKSCAMIFESRMNLNSMNSKKRKHQIHLYIIDS